MCYRIQTGDQGNAGRMGEFRILESTSRILKLEVKEMQAEWESTITRDAG